jgi:deoxyribonuclease (pyrimidine dimer)
MTRINTIDPKHLLDQHLFIEFREITRIHTAHRPLTVKEKAALQQYTLGTGHMKFFYDKGLYCAQRCVMLQIELTRRARVNYTPKQYKRHIDGLHNDWQPDDIAHHRNILRLHEKLQMRPQFYTYEGKPVSADYYFNLLDLY